MAGRSNTRSVVGFMGDSPVRDRSIAAIVWRLHRPNTRFTNREPRVLVEAAVDTVVHVVQALGSNVVVAEHREVWVAGAQQAEHPLGCVATHALTPSHEAFVLPRLITTRTSASTCGTEHRAHCPTSRRSGASRAVTFCHRIQTWHGLPRPVAARTFGDLCRQGDAERGSGQADRQPESVAARDAVAGHRGGAPAHSARLRTVCTGLWWRSRAQPGMLAWHAHATPWVHRCCTD